MSDYVGRHRLFRKIPYGYGYRLEPVVLHGNPNYVPRHYLSPLTAALRAAFSGVPKNNLSTAAAFDRRTYGCGVAHMQRKTWQPGNEEASGRYLCAACGL